VFSPKKNAGIFTPAFIFLRLGHARFTWQSGLIFYQCRLSAAARPPRKAGVTRHF
jgi:hypothetical protein